MGLHGQRAQAAADDHAESPLAVADLGAQADIVDGALDAVVSRAAIEGDLELARQIAGEVLAQEGVGHPLGVRAHVEYLVAGDAGPGAGGDVADGVVAGFAVGEAGIGQQVHQVGHARQRNEVILHILARGDVAAASAELFGDPAKLLHLADGREAAGDLAAHHLDPGLALPVDAMLQAEGAEFVFGDLPIQKCLGAMAEGFDLLANSVRVLNLKLFAFGKGCWCKRGHKSTDSR